MRALATFALALTLLAATAAPAPAQLIGMANPASTLCVATGGELIISDTATGQVGTCVYGGGLAIEEWTLFHLLSAWPGF
jgi:putative hemolysin